MIRRAPGAGIVGGLAVSALLHVGLAFLAILYTVMAEKPPALPPMYKVELIAAPPGPPAIGEVTDATTSPSTAAPPKVAPKPVPEAVPVPSTKAPNVFRKDAPKATPLPTKAKAPAVPLPKAGGGAVGGTGADVANVRTEGIDFPFPGYLQNIVRQIAVNFQPTDKSPRTAEVFFLVRRDGSMSGFRFLQRSGSYAFDLECQGAVEAAAAGKRFGALPAGFLDDVLPVIFRFDPKTLH